MVTACALSCCGPHEPTASNGDMHCFSDAGFPLSHTDPPKGSLREIEAGKPFHFEFGRGSGWHGLDTIVIDETGHTVLHRAKPPGWETTELQIPPAAVDQLCSLMDAHGMLSLQGGYHADVHDGTQWVFWMTQGKEYRSVYFNNFFPDNVRSFAAGLDRLLENHGLSAAKWTAVPEDLWRQHEEGIWYSIREKPFSSPPPQVFKQP